MADHPPYWFYIDEEGTIQGPFENTSMHEWFADSFFTLDTEVRAAFYDKETCTDKREFVAIGKRTDFFTKKEIEEIKASLKSLSSDLSSASSTSTTIISPTTTDMASASSTAPPLESSTTGKSSIDPVLFATSLSWRYIDKKGAIQGPFTTSQMKEWWDADYFTPSLQISGSSLPDQSLFSTIESLPSTCLPFTPTFDSALYPSTNDHEMSDEIVDDAPPAPTIETNPKWYYLAESYIGVGHGLDTTSLSNKLFTIQGPYSTRQMQYWFAKGFFTYEDTLIATESEANLASVTKWNDAAKLVVTQQNTMDLPQGFYYTTKHPRSDLLLPPTGPVTKMTSQVDRYIRSFNNPGYVSSQSQSQSHASTMAMLGNQHQHIEVKNTPSGNKHQGRNEQVSGFSSHSASQTINLHSHANTKSSRFTSSSQHSQHSQYSQQSQQPQHPQSQQSGTTGENKMVSTSVPANRGAGGLKPYIPPREPDWYYLDANEKQRGPFTSAQMRTWYSAGHLKNTLRVKEAGAPSQQFTEISKRSCCFVDKL